MTDEILSDNKPYHDAPLRVGLYVNSTTLWHWAYAVVESIVQSPVAEVVMIVENDIPHQSTLQRILQWDRFLYNVYTQLDNRIFRVAENPFVGLDLKQLLPDVPVIKVKPIEKKFSDYFEDEDIEKIESYQLDVVVRFGFRILKGKSLETAQYGVWSYHHADNLVNRGVQPGFWEVVENDPITGNILQILSSELDGGEVIYRSYGSTYNFSVRRNAVPAYWKTSQFVIRKLTELYYEGPSALVDPLGNNDYRAYSHRLYKTATNRQMLSVFPKMFFRNIKEGIQRLYSQDQWRIGYHIKRNRTEMPTVFHRFKWLKPPRSRFWADPFVVEEGGKFYIFVEDFVYNTDKGHISVIEMDEKGNYKDPIPVIEKDYHMSYPFLFRWEGDLYMIPETSANRTIDLYKCVSFPQTWEHMKTLMDDVRAVDATLWEHDGKWWMFTAIDEYGLITDELFIFYADSPLGPWHPHKRNPVVSDVRSARPAGNIFEWNGDFYRPSQDGSIRYGYATTINKIIQLDTETYVEEETSKILPNWLPDMNGTHTLNRVGSLVVIDGVFRTRKF